MSTPPFRALLRYISELALLHRRRVGYLINKFSLFLKLLLLIFIVVIFLLNFSDEIYSNIHNNYNYYLFLIYKSCLDLLSFFGLYFRMVINDLFTLWWCQRSGGELRPQTFNEATSLIQEEAAQSGACVKNGSSLLSADYISSKLNDITLHTTFLAENIEDINSSTDFYNNFNSNFSDGHNLLSGLGTQRLYNSPSDQMVDSNSSEDTVRDDQVSSAVLHLALSSEDRKEGQQGETDSRGLPLGGSAASLHPYGQESGAQINSSGEESPSSTKNISAEQPTTFNQNQLSLSSQPSDLFNNREKHSTLKDSSDKGELDSSLATNPLGMAALHFSESAGQNTHLPITDRVERSTGSSVDGSAEGGVDTAQPEATDHSKSTTKTVTFNSKSKILEFEHSLDKFDPYFDISDSREIDTKTEDGLGPINKDYTQKRIASNYGDQTMAGFSSTVSVQEDQTLEDQHMASSSSQTLEDQPKQDVVASSSSQSLTELEARFRTVASSSSLPQTGQEDQPTAGLSTSQGSGNKIITNLDLIGAIDALKNKGFLSSSFNLSGLTSADSYVATDTTSLSETEPSTTTTSDSPSDSSSYSATEAIEGTDKGKKRRLPSDLEESDLAPKRKKTD